jgi:acyl-CoA synthetase (NDP forming)
MAVHPAVPAHSRATPRLSGRDALNRAMDPSSVAVIGASSNPLKLGHMVLKTLFNAGFAGKIYAINPSAAAVLGLTTYARLVDVPGPVDVAVVIVPADQLFDVLAECAAKQVALVAAITSGFAEAGGQGPQLQARLEQILKTAPFRLLGPNCEGYVVPGSNTFVTFSMMTSGLRSGPVGIVGQSGAITGTLSYRLNKMGVGIRSLISTGNEADLTAVEALEWFADDPATNTVIGYLEQIREPRRFIDVARRMRGIKAIVIQKPGKGKATMASVATHTGAIAGDDRVVDDIFEELCIVRARDHTTAVDAAAALSFGKRLLGLKVAILSVAGGLAVEASDLFEAGGFEVPTFPDSLQSTIRASLPYFAAVRNPVDLTGAAFSSPTLFRQVIEEVVQEAVIDAVVVIVTFSQQAAFAEELMAAAKATDKPVLVVWTAPDTISPAPLAAFAKQSFPVFDSPLRAYTGLSAIARFSGLM